MSIDHVRSYSHRLIGRPIRLCLHDGRELIGVIHEVNDDGIMFAPHRPYAEEIAHSKKNVKIKHAIGKGSQRLHSQTVQFFFTPFFIPFFAIATFFVI